MKKTILFALILAPLFVFPQTVLPGDQGEPVSRILFLFDGSQSMLGKWQSDVKINIAKRMMSSLIDSLKSYNNLQIALRVYGHQKQYPPADCHDTKLEVPFADNNFDLVKNRIESLTPRGTTPLAYALEQSATDFPPCTNCRNIIILITDGIEECGGDPCTSSVLLQQNGVVMKPFIIGIGRDFKDAFNCVGTYFDAASEVSFKKDPDHRYQSGTAFNHTAGQFTGYKQQSIGDQRKPHILRSPYR